jgi:hypothetical protein
MIMQQNQQQVGCTTLNETCDILPVKHIGQPLMRHTICISAPLVEQGRELDI